MEERQQAPAGQPVIIMVVDDDPAVRNSLKFSLEIEGFTVRVHARARDLLNDADLGDCSCFIIDQNMPDMTGLAAVAELRRRQVSAPAILITSHPTAALRQRAAQAGISIVEKPLLGNALLERIMGVVDGRSRPASG
jgi:FixJ family two-component response regulator